MSDHLLHMAPRTNLNGGLKFIGAVEDQWDLYSDKASDYTLGRPIGHGASSIVYQAEYHALTNESSPCALKVLDLDSLPISSLQLLRRETQLMSLSKHPNVLRVRGTWMDGHKLYIALRLMRSGSVADVMHYGWPGGVEEEVARCVLKQALEGLNYLHTNGFIHRDVKAANLLIDDDGTVLLGDLGVAASLNEEDSTPMKSTAASTSGAVSPGPTVVRMASLGKRKSFVGTPCWMAPEVISQKHYDSKADIWSLGITALELAQGRAPRSRDPPYKVLLKTVEDEPPTLDREGGQFKYSKAFKEIIQSCLMKDPARRPTAEELLQSPFFKGSKKKSYLVRTVLNGLPPLVDRQERRRVASALTHLSMESWDFSQGGLPSPSVSTPRKDMHDDGLFEMEESVEAPESPEEDKPADFTPSSSSSGYNLDKPAETEDSARGDSTDDAVSTPSTTPISLSPTNSITLSGHLSKPVAIASGSSPTPSTRDDVSGSPSSFPGLWRKFRGKGMKTGTTIKEKRQNDPTTKSGIGTATDEKRRGAGDLMGSILQRSTSRTATILRT